MIFGTNTGEVPDKLALTCHPQEGFSKTSFLLHGVQWRLGMTDDKQLNRIESGILYFKKQMDFIIESMGIR